VEILVEYRVLGPTRGDREPPHEQRWRAAAGDVYPGAVAAYEKKLRGIVRLLEARAVQVPYWHITGTVVQGTLGRIQQDVKATRVRAYAVEHTVPGYARAARTQGPRPALDPSRALPLTVSLAATEAQFLPPDRRARAALPRDRQVVGQHV